jgi:hypothetical protein
MSAKNILSSASARFIVPQKAAVSYLADKKYKIP